MDDPDNYDLIINTEKLGIEGSVASIKRSFLEHCEASKPMVPEDKREFRARNEKGGKIMNRLERELLLGIAEEIVLQLRARLSEIESLHPRESAISIATFQERLWSIERPGRKSPGGIKEKKPKLGL